MNKNEFIFPELTIIYFVCEDIIATSSGVQLPDHNWD